MKCWHEWKHVIDGKYEIRSLYLDNANDKALREKIDGVNMREKFRIRYYSGDTSVISLEKKSKINGLCSKENALISKESAQAIVDMDYNIQTGLLCINFLNLETVTVPAGNTSIILEVKWDDFLPGMHLDYAISPDCILKYWF